MNVREINLLELKGKILSGALSQSDSAIVDALIWDFERENAACDAILVLGNPTCVERRLPAAIELFRRRQSATLLLSGGVVIPERGITEAEAMYAACVQAGIPKARLQLENASTTTRENIEFSSGIVSEMGIESPAIFIVSSPTHLRRVKMNFDRFSNLYPAGARASMYPSAPRERGGKDWMRDDATRNEVATEIGFIHEYLYELGYPPFDFDVRG